MSSSYPRSILTPHRPLPLDIPAGVAPTEFFNSPCNLRHLTRENGLLRSDEGFLLYRKAIGHSNLFDTSIIFDTSSKVLDPMGRPVRRDQLSREESLTFSRMTNVVFQYMLERYPDPKEHLVFCGEASLDATWPINKPGVPSIRMIHNHFMVFEQALLAKSAPASKDDPNLTDGGQNGLFLSYLSEVYLRFFDVLDLKVLRPVSSDACKLILTGYPQGLPSWEVVGGAEQLAKGQFWKEYDMVLRGFLEFYHTFFTLVASGDTKIPATAVYADQIEDILLYSDQFHQAARILRLQIIEDPMIANEIRWQPAYKQLLYRDDAGRLIVTISQNSVGNAITELLGIVVQRVADESAYAQIEERLVTQLLELRTRLVTYGLGEAIATPSWPSGSFVPPQKQH
ncbi:hypothetical protein JWJ90_10285 [Desulfobulbus rhabdoformis]|jgi:hypothetical protein|uniref:hypothetical protein n=1 Tax=Desulfobulbus rhabdoformis TaxID=34032 RepID=UPI00196531B8|nr:hypothetical protein [Desulfobulbus rhabdoformis]MBM9614674.1 hypothetical protein [Desulfobulbus rhabdoformis]